MSNLIEILAVARAVTPEVVESDLADARGYGDLKVAVAQAVVEYLTPVRERYTDLRADEPALEAVLADGADARARDRVTHARGRARADGCRRATSDVIDTVSTVSIATLDLDLDVFSGPFDLLLTLILREEIDLLELALADVVLAYLDHLESRGELDLETATEFIVLIAALLELKSRLMLAGEGEDDLLDMEPEEAAEELLARMLDAHRYRSAADSPAGAARARARDALSRIPAPGAPSPHRAFARRRGPRIRRSSARRSDGCWRCPRRSACATSAPSASPWPSALRICAGCCGVAPFQLR